MIYYYWIFTDPIITITRGPCEIGPFRLYPTFYPALNMIINAKSNPKSFGKSDNADVTGYL